MLAALFMSVPFGSIFCSRSTSRGFFGSAAGGVAVDPDPVAVEPPLVVPVAVGPAPVVPVAVEPLPVEPVALAAVLGDVLVFFGETAVLGAAVGAVFTFLVDAVGFATAGAVVGVVFAFVGRAVAAGRVVAVAGAAFGVFTCVVACEGFGGLLAPPRP